MVHGGNCKRVAVEEAVLTWAILATGQSMNQESADYVRGKCRVIVVSDAYKLAPWADCLVSSDGKWWMANPEAEHFAGEKYARHERRNVKMFRPTPVVVNSGLMAMHLAKDKGAERILLLGFDMHGTHYFGSHTARWGKSPGDVLTNTSEKRFRQHLAEFRNWRGCDVLNCTPNSALKCFPMGDLRTIL